jgi:thiol:disulfide interchange protein DsbC
MSMYRMTGRVLVAGLSIGLLAAPALGQSGGESDTLAKAAAQAEQGLKKNFVNLAFDNFGASPLKGPIYQASAGGQIIYYAPESEHILFATLYDRSGVNVTALAQEDLARTRLKAIDPAQALAIGPADAPTVIEFTDPDCPYCRSLDRFWHVQATQGRPVRRLIYFVSGIHPQAADKAEHILCSPDREAAQRAIYAGEAPKTLLRCKEGADKVAADAATVKAMGISGTPTLFLDGKMVSGFQQAEIEAWLEARRADKRSP